MFAPTYHPAMKVVAPVRRSLKIKTAFNILGPMLNPSRAPHSIVGVYHDNLVSRSILFCVLISEDCFLLFSVFVPMGINFAVFLLPSS